MRKERKEGKHAAGMLPVLFFFLICLCAGCGRGTVSPEEIFREKNVGSGKEGAAESESFSVAVAPLLVWEDPEEENLAGMLQESCRGMMVKLTGDSLAGSGVICGTEGEYLLIATAAHVVWDDAEGVQVRFSDGWETEEASVAVSETADLAVLRIPLARIPAERLDSYLAANMDRAVYEEMQAGDGCIVMGSAGEAAEDAYEGEVLDPWIYMEDYGQYMVWARAPGKPGMSGGGIFDRQGRLMGILSGYSEDGEWAAVPLAFLLTELSGGEETQEKFGAVIDN